MGFAPSQPFPLRAMASKHNFEFLISLTCCRCSLLQTTVHCLTLMSENFPASFMHFSTGEFIRPCCASVKANYDDDERLIVARLFPYTLLRGSKFCRFSQHQVLSGHSAKEIFSQSFWSITMAENSSQTFSPTRRRQSRNTSRETFVTIALMTLRDHLPISSCRFSSTVFSRLSSMRPAWAFTQFHGFVDM